MPALITFGRILFAVLFIYSGATKLFGVQATADFIAAKVAIPSLLAPYTAQLETLTGMPTPQLLALSVGSFEIIAGLMIALNFGARFFAFLLILFVLVVTFYFHDFWNQPAAGQCEGADRCAEKPVDHRRFVHHRGLWPRAAIVGAGLRGRVI